jgi:hypothetical protein
MESTGSPKRNCQHSAPPNHHSESEFAKSSFSSTGITPDNQRTCKPLPIPHRSNILTFEEPACIISDAALEEDMKDVCVKHVSKSYSDYYQFVITRRILGIPRTDGSHTKNDP